MRYYCTYFDSNFLSRGLTLYESLCTHEKEFTLYVLCLDDKAHDFFQQHHFAFIIPISLKDFEDGDTKLTDCKANRSRVEYIFTCTPSLPLYILNKYKNIDLLTYLDADLFFFSSPDPVFDEIGNSSIAIIAHRFSERNRHLEIHGVYNVGFLSFRNDMEGRLCLEWWRDKCIEWCYDHLDSDRFADQKYLDTWPTLFNNVCVVKYKGVNLAPWNIDNYSYKIAGGSLWVDGELLIVYHFHGLSSLGKFYYETKLENYCDNVNYKIILFIYDGYIKKLKLAAKKYDSSVCVTRYSDYNIKKDIFRLSVGSEIICQSCMLPTFCLSRIVRKFQPIHKIYKKLRSIITIRVDNGLE